jgi:hypothetical protein
MFRDTVAQKDKDLRALMCGALMKILFLILSSNTVLPPIVIAENKSVDDLGLPVYLPLSQLIDTHKPPKLIVYVGN